MESDTHLLYFTKLSGKSQDFYFLVGIHLNSSPAGQIGQHFTGVIFKCISIEEKFFILIQISLKFVPQGPNDNKAALVLIMAWCRTGDKPLAEPMLNQFTDA